MKAKNILSVASFLPVLVDGGVVEVFLLPQLIFADE